VKAEGRCIREGQMGREQHHTVTSEGVLEAALQAASCGALWAWCSTGGSTGGSTGDLMGGDYRVQLRAGSSGVGQREGADGTRARVGLVWKCYREGGGGVQQR
jgi:hypothetical protein